MRILKSYTLFSYMGVESPVRHWRLRKQMYGLIGEVCEHCDIKVFPPRDVCPSCKEETKTLYSFSGKGEVYSYTTVFDPPAGFEEVAPYTIALIKLEEGPLVTAQLTDLDNRHVEIGMPVEMVTRKMHNVDERGVIPYGYKFRPIIDPVENAVGS